MPTSLSSNDLDIDLLRQVDDQILKDIGIFSAGHRLRIRSAIAKLSSEATLGKDEHASDAANRPPVADVEIRQPRPSAVAGATPVSPAAEVAGERRYLTVMFCDLVGFDRHFRAARCRGVARPGRLLSRCCFGGGRRDGRPCRQEARRRADVAVRLSAGARERRRACGAGGAGDPARAGRT